MIIELLDGSRIDTGHYNLRRLLHEIPSANISNSTTSIEGSYDRVLESKLNNRVISVSFLYESENIYDYYLLRDEINALFLRTEPFYIIFKKESYKKYLVRTNKSFSLPPNPFMQSFNVEFLTMKPYGISTATSLESMNKEWDLDFFGWNGGIEWDIVNSYTHNTSKFSINNFGTYKVDPRESNLKIAVKGTGSFLSIKNLTNGNEYRFNDSLNANDNLVLDGVRTFKNGISSFSKTNKNLITLEPGVNEFEVSGITSPSISFDFNYLYK